MKSPLPIRLDGCVSSRLKRILTIAVIVVAGPSAVALATIGYFRFIYQTPSRCVRGDCQTGFGEKVYEDEKETRYVGNFEDGKFSGMGSLTTRQGDKYSGQWRAGKKNGYGIYYYPGGGVYKGQFHNNVKEGFGVYTWSDGTEYRGAWLDGEPEGQGQVTLPGGLVLRGEYRKGIVQSGAGIYVYDDGSRYVGEWRDGKRHGAGVMLREDGSVLQSGRWEDDEPVEASQNSSSSSG